MKQWRHCSGLVFRVTLAVVLVSGALTAAEDRRTEPGQDELFDVVLEAFKAEDSRFRLSAVSVLHMFSDRPVLARLVEALSDEDEDIAEAALDSLGYLGDQRALPAIERYMQNHQQSWAAMYHVLDALHLIAKPSAVEQVKTVLTYVQDDSLSQAAGIRGYATFVLGRIGTPEAKTVLRTLMHDRAGPVRIDAAANLAFLGEEDARSSLEKLQEGAEDSDYARRLLHVVSERPSQAERSRGLLWMLRLHQLHTAEIRKWWKQRIVDASLPAWHRGTLIKLYTDFVGKESCPFLETLLESSEEEIPVHAAAALLRLGDPRGVRVLEKALEDEAADLAWIVDALAPIDDPVKRPLLLRAYNSGDPLARIAAAGQLYELALQEDDRAKQQGEETTGTDRGSSR